MTYPAYPADAGEPAPQPGPPVEPLPALEYHQLHRAGRPGWWRPVVGILLLAVMMVLVGAVPAAVALVLALVVSGREPPVERVAAADRHRVTRPRSAWRTSTSRWPR